MQWRVPLADVRISEDEIAAIADTYRSGWLSMGPETERLEAAFAAYVDAPHAVACTNGTAALHLMLLAAGIGPGDDVVVPSMTFVATANAVRYTGARPVFADISSLDRPWITPATVEAALTPATRAILTMAYGGHPGDLLALKDQADRLGLWLFEDAAHAVGAFVHGRAVGTVGSGGAYSFFSNKNLPVGEGGMVVFAEDELAARARLLRSHGMTTLTWDRHRGHASAYDVVALGMNYRIDEPRATLARSRLAGLDTEIALRAAAAATYREALTDAEHISCLAPADSTDIHANHLFTVLVNERVDRDGLRRSLQERGVQTSLHYPPVHHFSIYAEGGSMLPVTDEFSSRVVTLPMFGHISASQQALVVDAIQDAARVGPVSSGVRARTANSP
jgi:dTDP-4-amino-4,6-dideoxygalactose transaminase